MIHLVKKKKIQFNSDDLFDLVNDTESYHEFLPFCELSQVISQEGNEKYCELVFSKGPFSSSLVTRNVLIPKERIDVFLHKGDFEHLHGVWLFEKMDDSCMVTVEFEYAFSSSIMANIFSPVFNSIAGHMVDIFLSRAKDVLR